MHLQWAMPRTEKSEKVPTKKKTTGLFCHLGELSLHGLQAVLLIKHCNQPLSPRLIYVSYNFTKIKNSVSVIAKHCENNFGHVHEG